MIADFTEAQRQQIIAGDRTIAAARLHELLREVGGLGDPPSIGECEEIVDMLVAGVEQQGK
ncbi:hypothetical protein [Rhizobium sp. Rhizsp42]|uniref:hypothetical protein n=1 Tax=Rhizobium sp. Rhizsp42 TaxID=3243034 RepID=UPI000DE03B8D